VTTQSVLPELKLLLLRPPRWTLSSVARVDMWVCTAEAMHPEEPTKVAYTRCALSDLAYGELFHRRAAQANLMRRLEAYLGGVFSDEDRKRAEAV